MMRRIALCIFMAVVVAIYSYFAYINSPAAVLNITNKPVDGTQRTPAIMSAWLTSIENSVNNVESAQIANGTIVNVDINASAAIVDSKFSCTSKWATVTDCDAAIANADAMHIHDAGAITFSTSTFTATDMESALVELSTAVGYSAAASAAATTTAAMYYMGVAIDDTNVWPGATPTASITVATGTASLGIVVDISADFQGLGAGVNPCNMHVPLQVDGVNFSTQASQNTRYVVGFGQSGAGASVGGVVTRRVIYRVADGWTPAAAHTVAVGMPYITTALSSCGAGFVRNFDIVLTALK